MSYSYGNKHKGRLWALEKLNLKINRAYLLKESFRQFWDDKTKGWAARFLKRWFWWATHSRLKLMRDFAWMLRRNEQGQDRQSQSLRMSLYSHVYYCSISRHLSDRTALCTRAAASARAFSLRCSSFSRSLIRLRSVFRSDFSLRLACRSQSLAFSEAFHHCAS